MGSKVWRQVVGIYIITYVLAIPWNLWLRNYKHAVSRNPVNNFLNITFVKGYGYLWFTTAYLLIGLYGHIDSRVSKSQIKRAGKLYLLNTICLIITNWWFLGPCIFERVDIAFGGHCQIAEDYIIGINPNTVAQCLKNPDNKWVSAFDLSGHYYVILTMSLLVWDQLTKGGIITWSSRDIVDLESQSIQLNTNPEPLSPNQLGIVKKCLQTFCITLLIIWYIEYIVTSLFFHTILEKAGGMILGLIVPLVGHLLV